MKQKFFVSILIFLAVGLFVVFSSHFSLANDGSNKEVVEEANQAGEEVAVEAVEAVEAVQKEPPVEDKYAPSEVPGDEVNKVDPDSEMPEEVDLGNPGEERATEGELNIEIGQESAAPAAPAEPAAPEEGADVEGDAQQNQGEPKPNAGSAPKPNAESAPASQQAPEDNK